MSNRFDKAVKKAQTASNKNQDQIKNKNRKKLDSELCNILKMRDNFGRKKNINLNYPVNFYVELHEKTFNFHETIIDLFDAFTTYTNKCPGLELNISFQEKRILNQITITVDWHSLVNNTTYNSREIDGLIGNQEVERKFNVIAESNKKNIKKAIASIFDSPDYRELGTVYSWRKVILRPSTFTIPVLNNHFRQMVQDIRKEHPYIEIFRYKQTNYIVIRVYWRIYTYFMEIGRRKTSSLYDYTKNQSFIKKKSSKIVKSTKSKIKNKFSKYRKLEDVIREQDENELPTYDETMKNRLQLKHGWNDNDSESEQEQDIPKKSKIKVKNKNKIKKKKKNTSASQSESYSEKYSDHDDQELWQPMPDQWDESARAPVVTKPSMYPDLGNIPTSVQNQSPQVYLPPAYPNFSLLQSHPIQQQSPNQNVPEKLKR